MFGIGGKGDRSEDGCNGECGSHGFCFGEIDIYFIINRKICLIYYDVWYEKPVLLTATTLTAIYNQNN